MSEFQDIEIVRVVSEEVTEPPNDGSPGCALYDVPFELSHKAPVKWADAFVRIWDYPPQFTSMHRPGIASVSGRRIVLTGTTMDRVEKDHKQTLSVVLKETNKVYRQWLSKQEEQRLRKDRESDAHRKSVEDAANRIKFD